MEQLSSSDNQENDKPRPEVFGAGVEIPYVLDPRIEAILNNPAEYFENARREIRKQVEEQMAAEDAEWHREMREKFRRTLVRLMLRKCD